MSNRQQSFDDSHRVEVWDPDWQEYRIYFLPHPEPVNREQRRANAGHIRRADRGFLKKKRSQQRFCVHCGPVCRMPADIIAYEVTE